MRVWTKDLLCTTLVAFAAVGAASLSASAESASVQAESSSEAAVRAERIEAAIVPIQYVVDGEPVSPAPGEEGFIVNGTTYVPLRFMANAVEKKVHWDAATSTVIVSEPAQAERLAMRERNRSAKASVSEERSGASEIRVLQVYRRPVTYVFDSVRIESGEAKAGLFYLDRLYVPLRFFGEAIGKQVNWNAKNYSIEIVSKKEVAENASSGNTVTPGDGSPPEDAVVPPLPPFAGGGGSGGQKPSYEELKTSAEEKLAQLQNRCESKLTTLADKFFETFDFRLLAEGEGAVAECDASFEGIIGELKNQLNRYGYDTSVIQEYWNAYEKLKSDKMAELQRRLQ